MDHSSQEQTARREAAEPILAARRGMLAALAARPRMLRLAALGAIVLLAAALRFANLGALGYANHYYAAAVESMLQSWRNFFFVAAEPGGAVSVDKPPVGLWIQAASALLFGVNGVGLLLPGLLAGLASVALLYHLVRRWFGAGAGLLAALLLAITPVAVAVDRNNTIDSLLIFVLLLTAWAFVRAAETGRLRVLLLGAALAGVGFNIKMLQAFLPLPAFYALYLFGARLGWGRKLAHLGAATLVLGAVSLSWALAVDLTPAELRPYVGSSTDNTVLELIAGHNGLDRLVGFGGGAPGSAGQRPNQRPGQSFQRPGGGQQFPGGGQPPQGGAPGGG
ncbi:MAG TPA: glycosyltransferase family 39 protein, partial [Herpetosiphonaceae bacterium]